jgi:hypothetical protein
LDPHSRAVSSTPLSAAKRRIDGVEGGVNRKENREIKKRPALWEESVYLA